jgi:hypothetical protein
MTNKSKLTDYRQKGKILLMLKGYAPGLKLFGLLDKYTWPSLIDQTNREKDNLCKNLNFYLAELGGV